MSIRYPGETSAYRSARDALLQEELALRAQTEHVGAVRRALPDGGAVAADYEFTSITGHQVAMSDLFRSKRETLAIYSLMYKPNDDNPCPMCVSLLDGLQGQANHIGQIVDFVVVSSASPDQLAALTQARGWSNLTLLSAQGTTYQCDYFGQTADGAQHPIMNVFRKNGKKISHFWGSEGYFAEFEGQPRHIDTLWPLWNLLDLTPGGRDAEWHPSLSY